ncbi:MAG TPA: hypothetical protein VGM41_04025 [Chitinophagaceae bacterium]|jgi:hypothetical protein
MIKALLLSTICISLFQPLAAQAPFSFMENGDGKPLFIQSNYVAEGSPYLNDEYRMAQVTALNGTVYSNVQVKLNLLDHVIQYLDRQGKEMITEIPIKQVKFTSYVSEDREVSELTFASYAGAMNAPNAVIYQVIDSGAITLLKNTSVSFRDEKKYGSANTTRIFERKETYSVLTPDGRVKHLERGKDNVIALFPDKQRQVEAFIEQEKLKCNSIKDCELVFTFYNSLK